MSQISQHKINFREIKDVCWFNGTNYLGWLHPQIIRYWMKPTKLTQGYRRWKIWHLAIQLLLVWPGCMLPLMSIGSLSCSFIISLDRSTGTWKCFHDMYNRTMMKLYSHALHFILGLASLCLGWSLSFSSCVIEDCLMCITHFGLFFPSLCHSWQKGGE